MKQNIKASFIIDGQIIEDRRKIANEFNTFFSSAAKKLNTKTRSSTLNASAESATFRSYFKNKRVKNSIFLSGTSPNELEEIVKTFENNKASDMSIFILKKCINYISGQLAGFFNHFITFGIFPDTLKLGKITRISKKGNPQLFDNYRPVSIIPIFSKIFEKVIYKRLYSFFPQ